MGIPISLNELSGNEGWILAESILNSYGQILYPENKLLDSTTVDNLKKHFFKRQNIENEISNIKINVKYNFTELPKKKRYLSDIKKQNCDVNTSIPQEIQNKTIQILDKFYNHSEDNINNVLSILYNCIDDISQKIINNPDLSYSLGQYREKNNTNTNDAKSIVNHSFRVAQFAIALAIIYNKQVAENERIPLKDIGTAALLHDYGLCFNDENELNKIRDIKLTDSFIKNYPTIPKDVLEQPYQKKYKNVYAYTALKDVLNSYTLTTILLSNEDEKGVSSLNITNTKTTSVSMAAKIIFLCNIYDSLLLNTISCNENLENVSTLLEAFIANGLINNTIGNLFINNIPLYSVGVRVELSNGQYATVIERFKGKYASKPIVQTLVNAPFIPENIDLRKTTNITIKRIVASSELLNKKIKEITRKQLETLDVTSISNYDTYNNLETDDNEILINKRK